MFCPICGNQLPEGSQFCASCGSRMPRNDHAPQQTPATAVTAPSAPKSLNVAAVTEAFFALMCFVFGFLPLIRGSETLRTGQSGSMSFGLFSSLGGDRVSVSYINTMLGIAKILLIIQIVVFVFYLVTRVIDVNKYIDVSLNVRKTVTGLYFGIYGIVLLFTLIGSLIGYTGALGAMNGTISFRPAVCWYIAVVLFICGLIVAIKPSVLDGIIKK